MELAATFYYVTMSLVAWIVGALLIVFLITLIRTLKIVQKTATQVQASVSNFEVVKNAVASGISAIIENFVGKKLKLLKGGGKHGEK